MISDSVPFYFCNTIVVGTVVIFRCSFLKYSEAHKFHHIFDILVFKSYLFSSEMLDNLIYPVNLSVPQLTFEGDVLMMSCRKRDR